MTSLLAWALRLAARETRRAETALAEAREAGDKFSELVELSSDWYWEQDEQFRFSVISGGVINKGISLASTSLGKKRWELDIHAPDAEAWQNHREQLERHEPFHDFRYTLRVAEDSLRNYSISGRPHFDAGGTFLGYRGVGHDVTSATRAEAALRQSESQLRQIADNMPAMFAYFTLDGGRICTYSNGRYAGFFGLTPEQAVGMHLHDILGEDILAALEPYWRRVEAGEVVRYERSRREKDGREVHIDVWLQPQRDAGGAVIGVYAMVSDITERKETEIQLRLAASVFESSQEGVTITDAERNIISVNNAFTRITGYAADEVTGRNPRFLKSGRQDASFYAAMWQAIEQHGSWSGEIWNRRKDGVIYPEILSITAIRDERGQPLHYIGIFTDITQIKQAEEAVRAANTDLERRVRERTAELEASNRELEAFSYSVAHDLRGPLRGIEGFAHVIAEDYADRLDEAGRNHLARIRQAAKRMAQLIDDLLELARIMRVEMDRIDIDLSALAQSVAQDLQAGSERPVEVRIAPGLEARADPTLMTSVLDNLLGNAWKFTARQAEACIEFGSEVHGGQQAFFVRDNGAGFDPAYADKLFQPFQRLHHPAEFAGTGIGLATAARIVRRHGGRIWAESQPGQGATFRFTLP
jgi:PAS domain S-box-containing protein